MTTLEPDGIKPSWRLRDRMQRSLDHAQLSVPDMAAELGVSRVSVWGWLHGRQKPRPMVLKLWALRTGVDYQWLVGEEDEEGKAGPDQDLDNPGYRRLAAVSL